MTVIEEYADLIRRLKELDSYDWHSCDIAMADAAKAILELAERCQAAETRCNIVDKFESLMREMAEEDITQ